MWQRTDNCICLQAGRQKVTSNSSTSLNVNWYLSLEKNPQNLGEEVGRLVLTREGLEKKVKYWLQRCLQTLSSGTFLLLPSEILNISPEKLNTYSNHNLKSELYLYGQAKYSYSEMGCQPNTIFLWNNLTYSKKSLGS